MDAIETDLLDRPAGPHKIIFSLPGESDQTIGTEPYIGPDIPDIFRYPPLTAVCVIPVHQPQDPIRAALERNMKMGAEIFLTIDDFDQRVGYLPGLD